MGEASRPPAPPACASSDPAPEAGPVRAGSKADTTRSPPARVPRNPYTEPRTAAHRSLDSRQGRECFEGSNPSPRSESPELKRNPVAWLARCDTGARVYDHGCPRSVADLRSAGVRVPHGRGGPSARRSNAAALGCRCGGRHPRVRLLRGDAGARGAAGAARDARDGANGEQAAGDAEADRRPADAVVGGRLRRGVRP
jgi:hypothetical protein